MLAHITEHCRAHLAHTYNYAYHSKPWTSCAGCMIRVNILSASDINKEITTRVRQTQQQPETAENLL